MKLLSTAILISSMLFGQVLYEEHFTDGAMQLDWHPWFTDAGGLGDSMQVISDPTTPGGDGWAGKISNEYMSVAGLTYAGTQGLTDYSIESWIYTVVTSGSGGSYNGITIRMDTTTRYYYRLVSDFDSDARIRLGMVGSGGYPVVLRDWTSSEIPGGVPSASSWHKFKLKTIADSIWAFYDDNMLPDCPIINDSIAQGFFGVYVFNMSATDSTRCDDIIVRNESPGITEYNTTRLKGFTVYPNPFCGKTVIRYTIQDSQYRIENSSLKIYDVAGRPVKKFSLLNTYTITWNGTDNTGNALAPGVYFIKSDNTVLKIVKLH